MTFHAVVSKISSSVQAGDHVLERGGKTEGKNLSRANQIAHETRHQGAKKRAPGSRTGSPRAFDACAYPRGMGCSGAVRWDEGAGLDRRLSFLAASRRKTGRRWRFIQGLDLLPGNLYSRFSGKRLLTELFKAVFRQFRHKELVVKSPGLEFCAETSWRDSSPSRTFILRTR